MLTWHPKQVVMFESESLIPLQKRRTRLWLYCRLDISQMKAIRGKPGGFLPFENDLGRASRLNKVHV
jgi:hypothetical protein